MNKPLETRDVRQAAYRGDDHQSEQTGIPDGKDRRDPSLENASTDRVRTDKPGGGVAQPNLGQAGTYGAEDEETEVTSKNRR